MGRNETGMVCVCVCVLRKKIRQCRREEKINIRVENEFIMRKKEEQVG